MNSPVQGIGKTFAALSVAVAVASGAAVFNWRTPMPKRTLYVDGEISTTIMQQWIEIHSSLYFSIIYYFYCKIFLSGSLDSPEKSACSLHFCGYICGYQNLGCPKREIA